MWNKGMRQSERGIKEDKREKRIKKQKNKWRPAGDWLTFGKCSPWVDRFLSCRSLCLLAYRPIHSHPSVYSASKKWRNKERNLTLASILDSVIKIKLSQSSSIDRSMDGWWVVVEEPDGSRNFYHFFFFFLKNINTRWLASSLFQLQLMQY